MISIIICSTNPTSLDALKENIHETIGSEYELIIIDNSANKYSIFSAYNKGLEISHYQYLCFIHEDIIFHSQDWGKSVTKHLNDPSCGLVGVCGGFALPRVPSTWSFGYFTEYLLQSDKKHKKSILINTASNKNENYKRVIALDGVFLCARKDLFEKIQFDEKHFNGFHFYDVDICLQAYFCGFENKAINDILIEHFSEGSQDRQWVEDSMILWEKWEKRLPVSVIEIEESQLQEKEYRYMTGIYMKRMIRADYSTQEIVQVMLFYLKHIYKKKKRKFLFKIMVKIFLTRLIKKPSSLTR